MAGATIASLHAAKGLTELLTEPEIADVRREDALAPAQGAVDKYQEAERTIDVGRL